MPVKADAIDFPGRFREIVSDPLNLLIERHPKAGMVENNYVYLHNGNKVPLSGPYAYYGDFSNILVINRGVHEPLEEYVFQELLKILTGTPSMIELGAYWGHYSMWIKKIFPEASVYLIEPDKNNIRAGVHNFERNNFQGRFIQELVGKGYFEIDRFLLSEKILKMDILHADIQGYEIEMLDGCNAALQNKTIDYLFISTHSQKLHNETIEKLALFDYMVEVCSDFENESTSYDGFIFASSPLAQKVFTNFSPFGRDQIINGSPEDIVARLVNILSLRDH